MNIIVSSALAIATVIIIIVAFIIISVAVVIFTIVVDLILSANCPKLPQSPPPVQIRSMPPPPGVLPTKLPMEAALASDEWVEAMSAYVKAKAAHWAAGRALGAAIAERERADVDFKQTDIAFTRAADDFNRAIAAKQNTQRKAELMRQTAQDI
ncbi:hypothetical protein F5Y16DRAFT_394189 [Xylariaceae sp. FL0255]|nr:hypothetical protein F5Y16DRAFT_394189 [Xylariaceae sp. FL0255]